MPRLLWLADAARSMGLTVVEVDGWKTRGRDEMNPRGVIAHHTATSASRPGDYPTLNTIINGRSDLPGPLSQYGLGRSGTVYVIASGKANHAGDGQWDTRPLGGSDFLDHSTEVIGIEAEHTGKSGTPWPTVQLDAYHRLCAGVLAHLGKPVANLCAHREWAQPPESTPNRKPDPIDLDMNEFRKVVAWHMNGDDMADPKVVKPAWFPAGDIQALVDFGVLTSAPVMEAVDYWRQLALMARLVKRLPSGGTAGPAGPPGPKGAKGDPGPAPKSATFTY